jgi:predicted ribosomally synthesized peptide with SipW-like signal peptide
MKKILISLFVIGLVSVAAFSATQAYFSDTETSENNTFTAGTLDLKVDDKDDPLSNVVIEDVYPGWGDYYTWVLKNAGTVDGQPTIEFSAIENYENVCQEPELDAGDNDCGNPGLGKGELGGKLYITLYWSNDNWSTSHEIRCNTNSGNHLLNSCDSKTVGVGAYHGGKSDTALPVLGSGETVEFKLHPWWHHTSTDDLGQSDSSVFDLIFHLDQV